MDDDLLALNAELLRKRPVSLLTWNWKSSGSVVYLFQAGGIGRPIKVGFTRNLRRRLANVRVNCPDDLVLLVAYPAEPEDEARLHEVLRSHHIRGEWFEAAEPVLRHALSKLPEVRLEDPRFVRTKRGRHLKSYQDAHAEAVSRGFTCKADWTTAHKKGELPGFPRRPSSYYSGWKSWWHFLAKRAEK